MKLSLGEKLLAAGSVFGILHHVDHVLRVDHSGYPFLSEVSPFTYSLLVYPIIVSVFLTRSYPWYRVAAAALLVLFPTLAHIFIETPADQFQTWAHGSTEPKYLGQPGLLGIYSAALGIAAAVLSLLLSLTLFAAFWAFVGEARRKSSRLTTGRREN